MGRVRLAARGFVARLRQRAGYAATPPTEIDGRVLAGQLQLLDGATWGALGNLVAVFAVSLIVRADLPAGARGLWIATMAASIASLFIWYLVARHGEADLDAEATTRRIRGHIFFATLIGACWGLPSLVFSGDLSHGHMLLLTVVVLSATAACGTALGAHLPAFLGFCFAALLPFALAFVRRSDEEAQWMSPLILLYIATLVVVVRQYNRGTLSTLRLRAENEALAESLATSQAATVAATRSKWDTLAHLSHELRTPMNAVIGFSEAMRQEIFGALSQRYRAYSNDIYASGRHALDLIDAILEASRAEAGQIDLAEETIDTDALVADCARLIEAAAAERQIELTCRAKHLPPLLGDRSKLRQALLNLLTNAVRYTPLGGRVAIDARASGDGLAITVADTGIGIEAEDVARCFEPFTRLSNPLTNAVPGTGLGLPIAKRLVEAHGGTIEIASTPRRGTRVTVRLPAARRLAPPVAATPSLVA